MVLLDDETIFIKNYYANRGLWRQYDPLKGRYCCSTEPKRVLREFVSKQPPRYMYEIFLMNYLFVVMRSYCPFALGSLAISINKVYTALFIEILYV